MKKIYIPMVVLFLGFWIAGIMLTTGVKGGIIFISATAFILVAGVSIVLSLCTYSPREIGRSFIIGFKKENIDVKELKTALLFFEALQRYLILAGIGGFLVGVISILASIEDKSLVGPAFAMSLITVFYALVLISLLAIPFQTGIKKRLAECVNL